MSRMIVAACIAVTLCLLCATGCSKKSPPQAKTPVQTQAPAPAQEQTKTAADYKAQADKEIKEDNAKQELDNLQKSINEESAQEQQ